MKLVVLEFKDEARKILEVYGKDFLCSKDTVVVCLHPAAGVFLKESGVKVHDTLEFFGNSKQQDIVLSAEGVISGLTKDLDLKDDLGLEKGYQETFTYHARFYINHFMWLIKVLEGIREKYAIKELICCQKPKGVSRIAKGFWALSPQISARRKASNINRSRLACPGRVCLKAWLKLSHGLSA